MNPPCVVSIDFDFFVKEDPMLDMGHRETSLFLETMWEIRMTSWAARGKTAQQMMPMPESVPQFVTRLRKLFDIPFSRVPAFSSESHAALPKMLKGLDITECDMVNFDAHHDIAYGRAASLKTKFDCGSWAGHLIETGVVKSYEQVYPTWRRKFPELSKQSMAKMALRWGADFHYGDAYAPPTRRKVDAVFLCRSGCWVPPVYDKDFNVLSACFGLGPMKERDVKINTRQLRAEREIMTQLGGAT
jgi:hypothetical protein